MQEKTQRKASNGGDVCPFGCRRKKKRKEWSQCSFVIALSTDISLMIQASSLCCTDRMGLNTR